MKRPGIALVTGASRGIGRALAAKLVAQGYQVFGTCRHPEALDDKDRISGVQYLSMDLSDDTSIYSLIQQFDRLDVLVNNAGVSQMGPVEEVPMDKIRGIFQTSFFGHVSLIQKVLPLMRRQRHGIIVNVTSLASHIPVPFSAVYAAGKAAMETLSNGLRNEIMAYGIHMVTVAPSFIKTGIYQEKLYPAIKDYQNGYEKACRIRDRNIETGTDASHVAKEIAKIIKKKNPRPFYAVGNKARILYFLSRHLPLKMKEKSLRKKFCLGK